MPHHTPASRLGIVLLLATITTACFPVFPVSPRVTPGLQSSLSLTTHYADARTFSVDDSTQTRSGLRPQASVMHEFGWVPASDERPALRVGLNAATGWKGVGATLFAQAPRRWTGDWHAGVGGLASIGGRDNGLFTSIGRQLANGRLVSLSGSLLHLSARREEARQRLGSLQLLVESPTARGGMVHMLGGAVLGTPDLRCGRTMPERGSVSSWCPWGTRAYVGSGMTLGWPGQRRLREREQARH